MSRHRNIRRPDLADEYDDVYGASYGASYDDHEICVSPGTEAQFMFPGRRRPSEGDDRPKRAHLDSIDEREVRDDYDVDMYMDELDLEEEEMPIEEVVEPSEYPKPKSMNEAIALENLKEDMKHGPRVMVPNLKQPKRKRIKHIRCRQSSLSKVFHNRRPLVDWFLPVRQFMSSYNSSHAYWFKFDNPAQRFALSSRTKGKLPTPVNEVDADSLVSRTGQRLNLGPSMKNEIPEKPSEEAILASEQSSSTKLKTQLKPTIVQSRDLSPMTKNGAPSSPSMRRLVKDTTIKPEVIESNYLKERKDMKESLNMVVIGHVDAGKSTLMGHLLYDMGYVGQKAMHRNETDSKKMGKSSFLYAWVLDETEEERTRGITMDVAQSRFETPNRKVTILDAPGHKDFIPNMITGASQADVAVLVVDATRGEFEAGFESGGQTREHTMLVRSLGVSQLAVVVNKLDNVKWDKSRYNEIIEKLKLFLKQTGFKEADVTFVPCSGLTGENLAKRSSEAHLTSWYNGPCLVEVIDTFRPPERPVTKPLRLIITDIFKGMIAGVSVSAKMSTGYIQIGQRVTILPPGEQATIKSIFIDEEPVNQAFAGDSVNVILLGTDHNNLNVGDVICDPLTPCPVTSKFESRIVIFNSVTIPVTKGLPVVFHHGSSSEQAVVKKLVSQINKSSGQVIKKHPRCLTKNTSGVVVIEVSKPLSVEKYVDNKDLGRFMLRYSGNTIAAGLVDNIL